MEWILQRAKAFAAAAGAAVIPAIVHAVAGAWDGVMTELPIPASLEATVTIFLVGLLVHAVPNKAL